METGKEAEIKMNESEVRVTNLVKEVENLCVKHGNTMMLHEVVIALTTYSNSLLTFGLKSAITQEVKLSKEAKK